jgi:hypothetical protein
MFQRLLILVGLLLLPGCQDNHEGAVKLTVSYTGFKPGCIRVGVKDEAGGSEERTTELPGKGEPTGGQVLVAAFREAGWGSTLLLTAQAFEVTCTGTPVSTATGSVTVDKAQVARLELKLSGTDGDKDGYVPRAMGGSDCDDSTGDVRPGAQERCNGRDDNCDDKKDEGFQVGVLCDTTDGCKGAWTCDPQGASACVSQPNQWRRDSDGDGQGDSKTQGISDCKQPAGYVPNALDCDDTNRRRYTGAPELCNAVDDDCDTVEDNGLGLGNACTGVGGCGGTFACNAADAGVRCNSPPPVVLYPDNDNDTRGAADAGVSSCEPTRPGHVDNANDCDDTRANVYVGAPEICDSQDNNCDGTRDETYNVGANCNPGLGCSGTRACAADGGTQCDYVTPPKNHYPDDDLDQHGKADAGVLTCAPNPGHITQAGDCDDSNPYTHASRGELCDQDDNDCDGLVDEDNVCPTPDGGIWADRSTASSDVWRSVALWGDGGVWVAGPGNRLRYQAPGQTSFQNFDGQCAGEWYAVWAHPQTGTAYLGGDNQRTAGHPATTTTCIPGPSLRNMDVYGITGVPLADGGTELHTAGFDFNDARYGWNRWWSGSSVQEGPTVPAPLWDVHGVSRDVLFTVGGYQASGSGNGARIYRFHPNATPVDWKSELVQDISGVVDDQLRGIWVVHPKLAYAVGESNSVLRWNGTTWSPHSGPNAGNLYSVVAFGTGSVYVTTESGRVFRYDGTTWSAMPGLNTGAPLWDIAGTSPGDLWVVGDNGKLLHWPR